MDEGYINYLLVEDMDEGEDGTNGTRKTPPALSMALLLQDGPSEIQQTWDG